MTSVARSIKLGPMVTENATPASTANGDTTTEARPGRVLTAGRASRNRRVAKLTEGVVRGRMSERGLADALDLGTTTVGRMLAGEQPWHLGDVLAGDVLALPPSLAADVLRAMLDEVERPGTAPSDPRVGAMLVGAASGDLQRTVIDAMADGQLDDVERRAIASDALSAVNACLALVRGVR